MGKKLFSVILSIVLCLSLSISAFAQEAGTTTTFAMEGKEYTLYVRDNVSVVTEVETGVRASFDNSTYILTIYENADAQPECQHHGICGERHDSGDPKDNKREHGKKHSGELL